MCSNRIIFTLSDVTRSFYSAMCECFERKTFTLRTDNKSFESTRLRLFTSSAMSNAAITVEHQNKITALSVRVLDDRRFCGSFHASVRRAMLTPSARKTPVSPPRRLGCKKPTLHRFFISLSRPQPLPSAFVRRCLKGRLVPNGILEWPDLSSPQSASCSSSWRRRPPLPARRHTTSRSTNAFAPSRTKLIAFASGRVEW